MEGYLQKTKFSFISGTNGLKMLQQLCCGFVLQDLETLFLRGDFNTLADRIGLIRYNNLSYQ